VNVVTLPATTATLAHTIPLSVLGMDYAPPEEAIGQRLLLRADKKRPANVYLRVNDPLPPAIDLIGMPWEWTEGDQDGTYRWAGPLGCLVAAGTLTGVAPIVDEHQTVYPYLHAEDGLLVTGRTDGFDIEAQRPYSDFSPTGPCPTCGGSGQITEGSVQDEYALDCPTCDGSGTVQRYAWLIEDVEAVVPPVPMPGHPDRLTEATW
jgi:hypothetical protein